MLAAGDHDTMALSLGAPTPPIAQPWQLASGAAGVLPWQAAGSPSGGWIISTATASLAIALPLHGMFDAAALEPSCPPTCDSPGAALAVFEPVAAAGQVALHMHATACTADLAQLNADAVSWLEGALCVGLLCVLAADDDAMRAGGRLGRIRTTV